MVAKYAASSIDVINFFRLQQVLPRLQSVGLAPAPRHVTARTEVVGDLQLQGAVDAHLITPLEREKVEHRGGAKLTGIGLEMTALVIGCQLHGGPVGERVVTADLEVVGALRPGVKSRRVAGLCGGALEIQLGKRDLLDIRRREQSAIIGMEDIRLVQLIRDADARTDLSFSVEALNDVTPHTEVHGHCIIQAPLVLNPKFLALLYVGIGRVLGDHRPGWETSHRVCCEVKQLELILRVRVLELETRLHEVAFVWNP